MKRIVLDNMIWRYVTDRGESASLARLERDGKFAVVIPPSIFLETLFTPDRDLRDRIIRTMTAINREKLRTDADLECGEVSWEIRRKRKHWCRPVPNSKMVKYWRNDWEKRKWKDAVDDSERLRAEQFGATFARIRKLEVDVKKENKELFEQQKVNFTRLLKSTVSTPYGEVEPWRQINFTHYYDLILRHIEGRSYSRTEIDWLEPWLKIEAIAKSRVEFEEFWCQEVELRNVRRNWMRTVINWIQPLRKVLDSNIGDGQHTTALFDVDGFVTCDRRYCELLEEIRKHSNVDFAPIIQLDASSSIVDQLVARI